MPRAPIAGSTSTEPDSVVGIPETIASNAIEAPRSHTRRARTRPHEGTHHCAPIEVTTVTVIALGLRSPARRRSLARARNTYVVPPPASNSRTGDTLQHA
ncbi:hypothetical protein FIBSPDRAFT_877947 [Athelia psychrophila]|uniref:Uncharacterized protein n=1 Tax=Athelia psychrophila TaxID=1759441 RepID=A0A167VHR6_9AGAM|nr:hypothetical protein FIBSPDRAFT_877947 [Fibularhizoctonia sp. CBS 109695]